MCKFKSAEINYPSQVLLESIACGNYIVATDNVDTDRIVKDKFGCLVDNSPDNIASGICKAIEFSVPTLTSKPSSQCIASILRSHLDAK